MSLIITCYQCGRRYDLAGYPSHYQFACACGAQLYHPQHPQYAASSQARAAAASGSTASQPAMSAATGSQGNLRSTAAYSQNAIQQMEQQIEQRTTAQPGISAEYARQQQQQRPISMQSQAALSAASAAAQVSAVSGSERCSKKSRP